MPLQDNPPQSALIINIFGIGDVLFTTPLISNLKAQHPTMRIGYLCNRRAAEMLQCNPMIDDLYIYDRDELNATFQKGTINGLRKVFSFIDSIKKGGFDTSIDVSLSDFTAWMTWMAGIPRRVGFKYKKRGFLLNYPLGLKGYEDKHVVEYYLDLLEHIGIKKDIKELHITINEEDGKWADGFIRKNIGENAPKMIIGMVPGGGASWGKDAKYKRWEPEKYAKLADNLIEKFSAALILFGDKSELDLCGKVSALMAKPSVSACGKTSISQFAALAQKCALMIVNDGGPLHIAVASGVQTASIFGPVNDHVYGPYPQGNHIVIKSELACRPCYRRFRRASCDHISCLSQLTVEEALKRIESEL